METIKFSTKIKQAILEQCKLAGYGRGYRKEIAERVLLEDEDIKKVGDKYTFNYSLFGEGTETDLYSTYHINEKHLLKQMIHINNEGYIDFDVWIYELGEFGELVQPLAVYVMVYEKHIKATLERPTQPDRFRFVTLAKAGKL